MRRSLDGPKASWPLEIMGSRSASSSANDTVNTAEDANAFFSRGAAVSFAIAHCRIRLGPWRRVCSCLAGWTGLPRRSKDLQALMMALRSSWG